MATVRTTGRPSVSRRRSITLAARGVRRTWWPVAVLCVVAVTLGACTSGSRGGSDRANAGAEASPDSTASAWAQVNAEVGPDGQVSTDTALRAFALAFGPLPGVSPPSGADAVISSGTGAMRWLVSHWSDISPAQRSAAIGLVPSLQALSASPPKATGASYVTDRALRAGTPTHPASYYTAIADAFAEEIESHVGVKLKVAIEASERPTQSTTADADSGVYSATGGFSGTPAKCVIRVNSSHPPTGEYLEAVLAHEVWHCFEGQVLGLDRYWSVQRASWIIEGEAEWVGYSLRPTAGPDGWWDAYIDHPEYRLFARTYSAIGFYSHLTDSGIDTWQKLIPILQAGTNDEAFAASGATSDRFLDTWASSYFAATRLGSAWIMTGPALPERPTAGRTRLEVSDGQASPFAAPAYTNGVFQLISQADVVTFAVTGHARLGDELFGVEYLLNAGGSFCTKNDGCACPAGSTSAGPPLSTLDPTPLLAVSGGPDGTRGTATGQSLDEYCKPKTPKAEVTTKGHIPAACPSGATVGHGATFQGAQPAGDSRVCGYYAPGEECVLGIGLIGNQSIPTSIPTSHKPIQIPGLGQAWYQTGGCYGRGVHLEIIIGNRGMTVDASTLEIAIDIAKRVLGLT